MKDKIKNHISMKKIKRENKFSLGIITYSTPCIVTHIESQNMKFWNKPESLILYFCTCLQGIYNKLNKKSEGCLPSDLMSDILHR